MGGSSVGVHTTRGRLQCKCLRLESDKDSCCLARISATVSFLWHCLPRHKETHGATCVFVCVRVLPYLSWAETKRFLWAAGSRDQRTAGRCEEGSSAELTPLRGCDSLETEGTLRGGGGREETLTFWCFNCTFTSEVFFYKTTPATAAAPEVIIFHPELYSPNDKTDSKILHFSSQLPCFHLQSRCRLASGYFVCSFTHPNSLGFKPAVYAYKPESRDRVTGGVVK